MIGGQLAPPHAHHSPKHNFEIKILFSVVGFQIENISLRRTLTHNPQGKGFKLCPGGI
jgi:hypothetical protein